MAKNPFAKLERDLPKGGKAAMRIAAEEAPTAAEQAMVNGMKKRAMYRTLGKAATGVGMGIASGVALDMLSNSEDAGDARADKTMQERAKYGDVSKNLSKQLPANLKGSPEMIDMPSPGRPAGKKPEEVARGFLKEVKRNYGPGPQPPVTEVTQVEDTPEQAKYEVRRGKDSKLSKNQAAAIGDTVARKVKSPSIYTDDDE